MSWRRVIKGELMSQGKSPEQGPLAHGVPGCTCFRIHGVIVITTLGATAATA